MTGRQKEREKERMKKKMIGGQRSKKSEGEGEKNERKGSKKFCDTLAYRPIATRHR